MIELQKPYITKYNMTPGDVYVPGTSLAILY